MSRVTRLTSSKTFLAILALVGGLSLGAMTTLAATQSRPTAASAAISDPARVAALGGSPPVDAVIGSAIDQAVDQSVDQTGAIKNSGNLRRDRRGR